MLVRTLGAAPRATTRLSDARQLLTAQAGAQAPVQSDVRTAPEGILGVIRVARSGCAGFTESQSLVAASAVSAIARARARHAQVCRLWQTCRACCANQPKEVG